MEKKFHQVKDVIGAMIIIYFSLLQVYTGNSSFMNSAIMASFGLSSGEAKNFMSIL